MGKNSRGTVKFNSAASPLSLFRSRSVGAVVVVGSHNNIVIEGRPGGLMVMTPRAVSKNSLSPTKGEGCASAKGIW